MNQRQPKVEIGHPGDPMPNLPPALAALDRGAIFKHGYYSVHDPATIVATLRAAGEAMGQEGIDRMAPTMLAAGHVLHGWASAIERGDPPEGA